MPEHLNNKMLTLKNTMLTASTSSTRVHEICSLDIDFLEKLPTHYTFHFLKITETARQGKLRPAVELTHFPDNNLCVCYHMDVYLKRTKARRKTEGQLLHSFISPHKFVTTQIVCQWIVEVLSLSGIDTSIFGPTQQDQPPYQKPGC